MEYDIGVLFYCEESNSLGEIIGKDGNKWIAKFYNSREAYCNPYNVTYGIAPTKHVILGKKKILELLNSNIKVAEIALESNKKKKEKTEEYKDINKTVSQTLKKINNLTFELSRLQKKQMIEFSENRKKQISCILKALKRNRKILVRLYSKMSIKRTSTFSWEQEIEKRKAEFNFAKMI